MPNAKFDAKSFNPEAFKYIMDRIPRTRLNEIRKSKVLVGNPDIRAVLGTQNGTGYARVAVRGLLDGEAVNYDGQTDITATSTKTFEQGVVVIGRAKAWVEKDFSFDITGGVDFMNNVAQQVADYWQDIDQDTILAVLKGVFSMTGGKSGEFVTKHTYPKAGDAECYGMAHRLSFVLGSITTPEGDIIHATGCEWTLAEDVLHVLLSYDHFVRVPLEQENMETLKINEEG